MISEWEDTLFKDAIEINPSYTLKKGGRFKKISMANLEPFVRRPSNYEVAKFNGGSKFKNGDTLVARITPCLENGKTCYVDILTDEEVGFGSTEFIVLRGREGISDNVYVYYLALLPEFRNICIKSMMGTSGRQRAQIDAIANWRFRIPKIGEQKEIATLLSSLDDKIELNRQMNATLEAIAQTLFKSWFVDFDPVWAKKEGRQPFGMDADTAALFPDEFEESELGLIPAGWRVVPLGEEFNITMGQSPPGNTYNEVGQGIPFYQGCRDFMFRYPLRRVYCTAPTRFARDGDTLVSVRAPVGNINMAIEPCAIGRGLAAVRHKGDGRSYTYLSMTFLKDFFAIFESHGTVFGSLSKKDFQGPSVCAPATEVINRFEQIVEPIDSQIENNELETLTLAALRDTLLPKLLSGELRVPTATESVLSQEVTLHDA
ncbi:MAG: restriction endonuclease subunit S [Firmicutes bacterium]|nr:restriction endonuclease subunit S [Bacillota bacterium]